jgi:uncharacterized protein (TIGR03067 family)
MDLEQLQGEWHFHGAVIKVNGLRFTTAQMGAEYSGRFEIQPAAAPKTITLHFETGPEAGNANHGIYELTDAGWLICLNITGGPAPAAFAAAEAKGIVLIRYTRPAAAEAAAAAPPPSGEPVAELQGEWKLMHCVRAGAALPGIITKAGLRRVQGTAATLHFGPTLMMQGTLTGDGPGCFVIHTADGAGPQRGIFEASGNTMKTCTGAPGRPRPTGYSSTKDGGETYSEWKRR